MWTGILSAALALTLLSCAAPATDSSSPPTDKTDAGMPTTEEDAGESTEFPDAGPEFVVDSGQGPGLGADAGGDPVADAGSFGPEDESTDGGVDGPWDPGSTGPIAFSVQETTLTRDGRSIGQRLLLPEGDLTGLLIVLPGFQVPIGAYASFQDHLATWGYAVLAVEPEASLLSTDHEAMKDDALAALDALLGSEGALPAFDGPIGVAGHSLGGKLALMWALEDPRVDAVFTVDPVNGGHPFFGYSEALPNLLEIGIEGLFIPLAFLGETTNATASGLGQPCAPAEQNFKTLFDGTPNAHPAYEWEIPDADHMDFVSDPDACGFACGACEEGTAPLDAVQEALLSLATAFFEKTLANRTEAEAHLTGTRAPENLVLRSRP
jgi:pimeloyl-ACP methyl ester carboxylesterase